MKTTGWENTTLAKDDLVKEVSHLKAQPGNDIITYGGANLASALIKENLIDEYHLFTNPIAIGKGMAIFNEVAKNFKLELIKSQSFPCGITVLCYKPV